MTKKNELSLEELSKLSGGTSNTNDAQEWIGENSNKILELYKGANKDLEEIYAVQDVVYTLTEAMTHCQTVQEAKEWVETRLLINVNNL